MSSTILVKNSSKNSKNKSNIKQSTYMKEIIIDGVNVETVDS